MTARGRLDQHLVALGLADSRTRARRLIEAGAVTVDGATATRPALSVPTDARIAVAAAPFEWASRGGVKLAHALDAFGLSPSGATVLDIGASTGGFTDVCLARGARAVVAVDVGRDQLHPRLAADPRVREVSGRNAKELTAADLADVGVGPTPDWLVADVSFISLTKALPRPLSLLAPSATLVALVKPQFELSPDDIGKGGRVTSDAARARAAASVRAWTEAQGWRVLGVIDSPILGGDGAQEYLMAAARP